MHAVPGWLHVTGTAHCTVPHSALQAADTHCKMAHDCALVKQMGDSDDALTNAAGFSDRGARHSWHAGWSHGSARHSGCVRAHDTHGGKPAK